ncbi:rhodanese-like domain-containing protein [Pedobacter sp. N23S346]|uniref:rhodanese-like domain-containing protein n=1 Tax=Pedobacter sp. N23S346 TaxID=3402750 RepID=UPI003AD0B404
MNTKYLIKQFEDKPLAHYAYAIVSGGEMVLIDPARNPQPYYDFAKEQDVKIVGVVETHPHADFVSSHLEISLTTGATVYTSKLVGAEYPHHGFDDGDKMNIGSVKLKSLNTPGHSPDSICVVLEGEGKDIAVFTGDTLFIGDCGRPDLRETARKITATREALAKEMFHSLRNRLMPLNDDVLVYPAHGAGTLCGKGLSEANSSTMGAEKLTNWSLQKCTEEEFVKQLMADQPFIPKYFGFDVALNKKGANDFLAGISGVPRLEKINDEFDAHKLEADVIIIDTRPQQQFKAAHFANSINIQIGGKFETWLGSIINPIEWFYLTAETESQLTELIERIAKIGYEAQIKGAFVGSFDTTIPSFLDLTNFSAHQTDYTIIDIRNMSEVSEKQIFETAIHIPLAELRERVKEIPTEKPIVVHCAGGYRSAIGSSIINNSLAGKAVYDLGEAVTAF